jgi:hypothetical protein
MTASGMHICRSECLLKLPQNLQLHSVQGIQQGLTTKVVTKCGMTNNPQALQPHVLENGLRLLMAEDPLAAGTEMYGHDEFQACMHDISCLLQHATNG